MPPFKIKFTAHPQHDAEGFTVMDAKCRGCEPTEMCPRSGHCDRYMSPLRDIYGIAAEMIHAAYNIVEDRRVNAMLAPYGIISADEISTSTVEEKMAVAEFFLNPMCAPYGKDLGLYDRGDYEADRLRRFDIRPGAGSGVDLSKGEPVKLSEMTDAELNDVHQQWLRSARAS